MKKVIFLIIILLASHLGFGQATKTLTSVKQEELNKRISIVVGVGASYAAFNTLYQMPTVNPTNNYVIVEEAQNLKSSISLGIVYTPYLYTITNGSSVETVNKGWSYALFVSPNILSTLTNSDFFSNTDFGIGYGYKGAGGFLFLITADFLVARQPKDWFINDYKNGSTQYLIDGAPQSAFDPTDNNIFRTKLIPTLGFKVCYTFDIVKSYRDLVNDGE